MRATIRALANDGYVCRLPFRAGAHEGSNNIIDNLIPLNAQVP